MSNVEFALFALVVALGIVAPWRDPDKDSGLRLLWRLLGLVIYTGALIYLDLVYLKIVVA